MTRLHTRTLWTLLSTLLVAVVLSATFIACGKRGDSEKAGEKIDDAVEGAKEGAEDLIDKDGPVENAGEKVDDAIDGDK